MRYLNIKRVVVLLLAIAFIAMGSWYYFAQLQQTDTEPERADLVMAYSLTR